jgi:hypothetical protein
MHFEKSLSALAVCNDEKLNALSTAMLTAAFQTTGKLEDGGAYFESRLKSIMPFCYLRSPPARL